MMHRHAREALVGLFVFTAIFNMGALFDWKWPPNSEFLLSVIAAASVVTALSIGAIWDCSKRNGQDRLAGF
jgi:hypothetical protein